MKKFFTFLLLTIFLISIVEASCPTTQVCETVPIFKNICSNKRICQKTPYDVKVAGIVWHLYRSVCHTERVCADKITFTKQCSTVNDYQNCQEPTPIQSTSSCFDSVSFQGAWNDGGIATADGNWNSKSYPLNQNELAYVYLTKTRNGHSDATLKTKYMFGVGTTIQDSIPSVCLAQADVKIRIGVKFTSLVNVWYWECFDGTSWNQFELHNSNRQSSDNNAYLWESCISFM